MVAMIRQFFEAPSGRLSIRRGMFALSVVTACGCSVGALVLDRDIHAGVVSVLVSTIGATAAAAGIGRFAEGKKEAQ